MIKSILGTTITMLLAAVLWLLLGHVYNVLMNREATEYKWRTYAPGEMRIIDAKKLEDYEKVQGFSILIGLAVGLCVSLASKRSGADTRA